MTDAARDFLKGNTPLPLGRANLDEFALTLEALAAADRDVMVVCSDSRGSGRLTRFGERFPRQMVEVGIAEQTLVGVAAGLASCGKKVFAVSPASFLTARALEQIKNDVCYSNNPVALVGISAGVSYGALGSTHHSLHDLAALRCIDNLTIVVPADNRETAQAVCWAAQGNRPAYLRFGKAKMHHVHADDAPIEIGRAALVRPGDDVAFIATGEAVRQCVFAAEWLAEKGLSARVLSMHTVKPLDGKTVLAAARETGAVITAEEHSIHGGLGEACAAALLEGGVHPRFRRVGIADEHTVTGSQAEILSHYGLNGRSLAEAAKQLLEAPHG